MTLDEIEAHIDQYGIHALSLEALLTLLLADAPHAAQLASYLHAHFPELMDLEKAPVDTLTSIPGIGKTRALRIKAALALAKRLHIPGDQKPVIRRPSDAVRLVQDRFVHIPQEQLIVLLMDIHNQVDEVETVYIGSLNSTSVRTAEVLRPAIIRNNAALIVMHNHPSGAPYPSPEDIQFTENLIAAGLLMDIAVLDHIIIGDGTWYSMREQGMAFAPTDTQSTDKTESPPD